jgi:hypothetical protein
MVCATRFFCLQRYFHCHTDSKNLTVFQKTRRVLPENTPRIFLNTPSFKKFSACFSLTASLLSKNGYPRPLSWKQQVACCTIFQHDRRKMLVCKQYTIRKLSLRFFKVSDNFQFWNWLLPHGLEKSNDFSFAPSVWHFSKNWLFQTVQVNCNCGNYTIFSNCWIVAAFFSIP